jgi:hypothetical protein
MHYNIYSCSQVWWRDVVLPTIPLKSALCQKCMVQLHKRAPSYMCVWLDQVSYLSKWNLCCRSTRFVIKPQPPVNIYYVHVTHLWYSSERTPMSECKTQIQTLWCRVLQHLLLQGQDSVQTITVNVKTISTSTECKSALHHS